MILYLTIYSKFVNAYAFYSMTSHLLLYIAQTVMRRVWHFSISDKEKQLIKYQYLHMII